MDWKIATDIILYSSILLVAIFAIFGFCQLISRKSLKKVDKELTRMPIPLALMAITYYIFDHFVILATAPNGSGKPSFPSSHAMVVATIFALTTLALPKYVKSRTTRVILYFVMLAFVAITAVGRVITLDHWPTDVACGVVFGIIFGTIYYMLIKEKKKNV